ncbi:hypothetical protein Tco_1443637 [Tanacetum coccineum]
MNIVVGSHVWVKDTTETWIDGQKEMPTTEATAQGIASMLCAHGPKVNGEYSPYGKMLKVPEIMKAA